MSKFAGRELFLYRHRETGNWVLAAWKYRPHTGKGPGLMIEVEVMEQDPDACGSTRPSDTFMAMQLRSDRHTRQQRMKRRLLDMRHHQNEIRRNRVEEKTETYQMLKKKGLIQTAAALKNGLLPFAGSLEVGASKMDETRRYVADLARRTK